MTVARRQRNILLVILVAGAFLIPGSPVSAQARPQVQASLKIPAAGNVQIVPGAESHPLVSYGVRFLGESLSFDLGFLNVLGEDGFFPGIPLIDFVFSF
jgi:hypothetical protein